MYKKLSFFMGIAALMTVGCEADSISKATPFSEVQRCINSNGTYDFNVGKCVCGGNICKSSDNENVYEVCNDKLECVECYGDEKKCDVIKCDAAKNNNENCTNINSGDNKLYLYECKDNQWEISECEFGCDTQNLSCFECDPKSDSLICSPKPELSCNKDNNSNNEIDETLNDETSVFMNNPLKKDGHIYQCIDGYYTIKELCDANCDVDNSTCKIRKCIDNEKKCIEKDGNAIILTCVNGVWPIPQDYNVDNEWSECEGLVEIHKNKVCHHTEPKAVTCASTRCLTAKDWSELSCEEYKAVVLSFVNKFEGIDYDRFSEQLGGWFNIKFNGELLEMGDCLEYKTPISICKPSNEGYFLFPKLKDEIELVDGVSIDVYKNGNNTKCDDSSNTEGDDSNNTELQGCLDSGDSENNMECKYNTISTVNDCKEFIENYMCEFDNYFENGQKLFSIVSDEAKGAVLSCNPETNTWDIKQVEPCLTISIGDHASIDKNTGLECDKNTSDDNCNIYYDFIFKLKGCAPIQNGAKYSNVCAI